jgi:pyridoxamine 5'-phosphate oxidase family protein
MPESVYTPAELDYLRGQLLGRLATVGAHGRPRVTPVGVYLDSHTGTDLLIVGHEMGASAKYNDVLRRPDLAFVVDDLESTEPWTPRGIQIRGWGEAVPTGAERMSVDWPVDAAFIRIHPRRILTWGIESDSFEQLARDV